MRRLSAPGYVASAALCLTSACGQKGPPLPPLHLVPEAVSQLTVRRVDDTVRLRFVLPVKNANGPGQLDLDHVEIYAMTVPPGSPPPANRILLSKEYIIGQIAVRPAPVEGEPAAEAPVEGDTRPEPGATVTFDEKLDEAKLTPVVLKTAAGAAAVAAQTGAAPAAPAAAVPPVSDAAGTGTETALAVAGLPAVLPGVAVAPAPENSLVVVTPAAPAAAAPKFAQRIYVVRGVTRSGRFGPPAPRAEVALVPLPSPPVAVTSRVTETAVVLEWKPPGEPPLPVSYNLYRAEDPLQPLNAAPIAAASFEYTDVKLGDDYCFRLRGVALAGAVPSEGPLSEETCVTPRDVFAPAAPTRLDAVPTPGQISLIWEANTEKDLAGYLVLRGEAPDGALQAITPVPIRETSYKDTSVKPGVRYIYAVVAVDGATPPNVSAQSPRVEETAR